MLINSKPLPQKGIFTAILECSEFSREISRLGLYMNVRELAIDNELAPQYCGIKITAGKEDTNKSALLGFFWF